MFFVTESITVYWLALYDSATYVLLTQVNLNIWPIKCYVFLRFHQQNKGGNMSFMESCVHGTRLTAVPLPSQ